MPVSAISTGLLIGLIVGGVIVLILLCLAFYVISFYNKMKIRENNIESAFAQLDVQLKRRYDLLPNIIETTKGYAKHEQETLTKIIEARNKAAASVTIEDKIASNELLKGVSSKFNMLAEQYPELKANTNFLALQKELSETENKIGHFRQFFNDSILIFNRAISTFPNSLLARFMNFDKKDYLEVSDIERENIKVQF